MPPSAEEIVAGQAFYTDRTLPNYDLRVLTLSNPLIWRCPTSRLLRFFDTHVSANHLDVGVGSGYFLDHCIFPSPQPRIARAIHHGHATAADLRLDLVMAVDGGDRALKKRLVGHGRRGLSSRARASPA